MRDGSTAPAPKFCVKGPKEKDELGGVSAESVLINMVCSCIYLRQRKKA